MSRASNRASNRASTLQAQRESVDLQALRAEASARIWEHVTGTSDPAACWLYFGPPPRGQRKRFVCVRRYPRIRIQGRHYTVRRLVYFLLSGTPLPAHARLLYACGRDDCVNPAHAEVVSVAELGRRITPTTKLDAQAVARLRARYFDGTQPTQAQVAHEFGVTPTYAGCVIRGEYWRESV